MAWITCNIFSELVIKYIWKPKLTRWHFIMQLDWYNVKFNYIIFHTQLWQNTYELPRFTSEAEMKIFWGGDWRGLCKKIFQTDSLLDKWESIYMSWGSFLKYSNATFTNFLWESRYASENLLQQSKTSNTKQDSSSELLWKASQIVGELTLL